MATSAPTVTTPPATNKSPLKYPRSARPNANSSAKDASTRNAPDAHAALAAGKRLEHRAEPRDDQPRGPIAKPCSSV